MGAIVTTFQIHEPRTACALVKWCVNAHAIPRLYGLDHVDVVLFTDDLQTASQLCPHAIIKPFPPRLQRAAATYQRKVESAHSNSHPTSGVFCHYTLLKFAALSPVAYDKPYKTALYLDADVDLSKSRIDRRSTILQRLPAYIADLEASPCQLRATPDHSSPINDGVMLFKPSTDVYEEALALMQRGDFSLREGFDQVGRVREVIRRPAHGVNKSKAYRLDTWDFVCSGGSQGIFSHLYMVRRPAGAFCTPTDWYVRVRHYWAGDKPWNWRGCASYFEFDRGGSNVSKSGPAYCAKWFKKGVTNKGPCRGSAWPIV